MFFKCIFLYFVSNLLDMREKLTHSLPQIRCSEDTKQAFEKMAEKSRRTITNVLQIFTEKIAQDFRKDGKVDLP